MESIALLVLDFAVLSLVSEFQVALALEILKPDLRLVLLLLLSKQVWNLVVWEESMFQCVLMAIEVEIESVL